MAVFHQVFGLGVVPLKLDFFGLVNILSAQGVDERMINVHSSSSSSS